MAVPRAGVVRFGIVGPHSGTMRAHPILRCGNRGGRGDKSPPHMAAGGGGAAHPTLMIIFAKLFYLFKNSFDIFLNELN